MIGDQRGNLPLDLSVFIGRDPLLSTVTQLIPHVQLLTLTGPGGVGKTRLAIRAGAQLRPGVVDSSWLVDFGAVSGDVSTAMLWAHMALAMGIRHHGDAGLEVILGHLRDRRALLILDTCDHLVPQTRAVTTALLQAAPHLRIIATSRERLGLDGEHVVTVPPLAVADSVLLFLQLVARVGVDPSALSLSDAEELCRRLDGLPLAIKLAAGRAGALSTRELVERIDDRFTLLTDASAGPGRGLSGRHAGLVTVVDLSYQLCNPAERIVWASCAVFTESFTMAAAEAVAGHEQATPADIVNAVTRLVDKSVFTRLDAESDDQPARYTMLDTLREYGLNRLDEAGATPQARARHRDYYRDYLARAAADWFGASELMVLSGVRRELPDIITAIDYSVEVGDLPAARALCRDLCRVRAPFFWGFLDLVARHLDRVIALSGSAADDDLEAVDVAATRAAAAWIATTQGRHETARRLVEQARAGLDTRGLPTIAPVLFAAGGSAALLEGTREAIGQLAAARDLSAGPDARGDRHMATMMWAIGSAFADEVDIAEAATRQYLSQAEQAGAPWAISWALWAAALAALRAGRHQQASELSDRGLRLQRDMTDLWGQTWSIELRAWILAATLGTGTEAGEDTDTGAGTGTRAVDKARRAAWLLGAALARQQRIGVVLSGLRPLATGHEQARARIVAVLGDIATAEEIAAGGQAEGHALRIALGEPVSRRASASPDSQLTDRETEIARLVTEGLTSPEIGRRLHISPRTVDTHIRNTVSKLGLANRAALASWFASSTRSASS